MSSFDPAAFGPAVAELLRVRPRLPLARPKPTPGVADLLRKSASTCGASGLLSDPDLAAACLAGLWLAHGYLDASHQISQEIKSPTGSYWHGLMHRLEPDFDNSKYWFRRVGRHAIFAELQAEAVRIAASHGDAAPAFLRTQTAWDPFAFVDLCRECVEGGSAAVTLCEEIQEREWELLFEFSYRGAMSG